MLQNQPQRGKLPKTIVMLSGGMDSAVALAEAVKKYGHEQVWAVTFDYGQRHIRELDAVSKLVNHYDVGWKYFPIDLTKIGGSSLTDTKIEVPDLESDIRPQEVAMTYVPMRNTIFLAICAAYAEVLGCETIYTGFNWIDSGGYPDTTQIYVDVMNLMLAIGSRDQPKIVAPLVKMTKAQIVQRGEELKVPWQITWSCYKGLAKPCGICNACVQREKGFREAGVEDPLEVI